MSVSSLLLCIIIIWDHFSAYCKIMRNGPKKIIRCFVLLWQALIISRKYHISKIKKLFSFLEDIKIRNCVSISCHFACDDSFKILQPTYDVLKCRLVFPQFFLTAFTHTWQNYTNTYFVIVVVNGQRSKKSDFLFWQHS